MADLLKMSDVPGVQSDGAPSPNSQLQTLGAPAPTGPTAPGITPLNTSSARELLPTGAPPPAPSTQQTPTSGPGTTPVVAAPTMGTVSPQSTVSGQIRELLDSGGPYLQQARERARQQAGNMGLQNSSIAVQSGEQAAISAALPIASQDATTNFNQGLANQNAANQFGLNAQSIEGQSRLQAETSVQRMAEAALQGDIQSKQMLEQAGYNFQLSAQDNINKLQQLAAQGDQQARLALQQFGFQTDLLSQENRNKLEQLSAQGDQSARLALLDYNYRAILMDQEAGINITLEDKRFQQQQKLLMDEYAQRTGLSQAESDMTIQRMNVAHQQTLEQIAAQAAAAKSSDFGPRLQAQYLASVSDRMNAGSTEIAQIFQTQGLTAAQQNAAVAQAQVRMQKDLSSLQAYYQQSPLWDDAWGTGPTGGTGTPPANTPIGNPPAVVPAPNGGWIPPPGLGPFNGLGLAGER